MNDFETVMLGFEVFMVKKQLRRKVFELFLTNAIGIQWMPFIEKWKEASLDNFRLREKFHKVNKD
jgi:hypothetical protein